MQLCPITLSEAAAFVTRHHRHHSAPVGHKFSVAVEDGGHIIGVAIVGRPVSRVEDDTWTLELTRLCVLEGHSNAASMLLGAARRAAWALGYKRLITYTLPDEGGASLRAAGYRCIGSAGGGSWSCESRPRVDKHPLQRKIKWRCGDARQSDEEY